MTLRIKLVRLWADMEQIGCTDMAQLSLRQAREFHDATETIRRIAREVQEGKS